jgi:hypothetical protein
VFCSAQYKSYLKLSSKGSLGDVILNIPGSALGRHMKKMIHSVGSPPLRIPE